MRPFGHLQFCHSGESGNLPQQCNASQVSAVVEMAPMRVGPMRPFVPDLRNYFTVFCQKRDTCSSSLQLSHRSPFKPVESEMQYMLLIHSKEGGWAKMSKVEQEQGLAAHMAYGQALKVAGAYVGADLLCDSTTASFVKVRDGKTKVLNRPYTESKEQLGGYYLIEVKDLDVALGWAAKCRSAYHGTVEVRPVWSM